MSPVARLRGSPLRAALKGYLLVGLVIIVGAIAIFTLRIVRQIDAQAELSTQLVGELLAEAVLSDRSPDELAARLQPIRDAIDGFDFPFVITDVAGHPFLWNAHQTGVELPVDLDLSDLLTVNLGEDADSRTAELLRLVREFDAQHDPIDVIGAGGDDVLLRLHFGRGRLSRQVLLMPLLEALLIVLFMGVALIAFRNMKRSEQRSLWVGMAKETAHQMGTPLTSLNGWLELLSDEEVLAHADEEDGLDRDAVLREIRSDVERLARVSGRFSQIGSRGKLVPGRPDLLAAAVCSYFRRRLPHLGRQVEIIERLDAVDEIPISPDLLDWALENLVKNALDASDKSKGEVIVVCRLSDDGNSVLLSVEDNGKGMSSVVQKQVFDAGFSTKERGWGMGLVLVRRIIEEYHGGSIRVAKSVEGEGTRMEILLPLVQV